MEDVRTLAVALLLVGYALFSRRLERWWISMPMAMVALGLLVGEDGLGVLDLSLGSETVKQVAEATLALMLFRDAARIDLRALRVEYGLPLRLLGIGLPVMILVGTGLSALLLPGLGLVGAALLATMLAPTDAALGDAVVSDKRLPVWLRQGLNVESGLNDGLSVPVFLVLLEVAVAEAGSQGWQIGSVATEFLRQVGYGVVAGVLIGGVGGWLVRWASARRFMEALWQPIAVFALALATFVMAAYLGGSGFIGAFVGGVAFGIMAQERGPKNTLLTGYVGTVLDALSFVLVGAILIPYALPLLTWPIVLYVVLSLVLVRLISVAVAMIGSGALWPTTAFMGWFGPRGLATVVFTVILFDEQLSFGGPIIAGAVLCVAMSVVAHGLTAPPLAGLYARWYESKLKDETVAMRESTPAFEHPPRSEGIRH